MNRATREDLGIWIRGRLKNGVEARTAAAQKELAKINISKDELRKQWEEQKAAQLSVRKHAPARLKKELDSVLNLQTELSTVETSLTRLQASVESGDESPIVHEYIASLKRSHARAVEKAEGLYASLNVPQEYPELKGLPLNFVQILLLARDLKINIRKRAIGSFFEWDKLSQAAGGRDQPLVSAISFLLLQRKEELLLLPMRWRTPLVSAQRFQSRTEEAARIAERLTGAVDRKPIRWVCIPFQDGVAELSPHVPVGDYVDEDAVIAHDTLEELLSFEDTDTEDDTPALQDAVAHKASPIYCDLTDVDMIQRTLLFTDEHPYDPTFTTAIPLPPAPSVPPAPADTTRVLHPNEDRQLRFFFRPNDLARLQRPQAMLSDDCINSSAEVLLRYAGNPPINRRPTIFSTRLMSLHRSSADDASIWRDSGWTTYWQADLWLIPIHRLAPAPHWTLAIVYLKKDPQQIAYFDSLALGAIWETDVKASPILFTLYQCR
ncbi:hypothetical protein TRAPUB_2245 [Trametes pubescens]|uniref:Ubiquitin-like protease family profile domain-containing protein n=1 Tax=Trametes pubescens TaxID=154538 RepID=A0A1M2VH38_TRAPU|nr:hypothetical protein TRAPUB_2245 [Trametes pubescens]